MHNAVLSFVDATLSEFGNADEPDGGYRLDVCKYNSIYYQNISLELIQSVELNAMVGSQQQSKISSLKPVCCGLFSCVGVSIVRGLLPSAVDY